jgi:hypothetical protein
MDEKELPPKQGFSLETGWATGLNVAVANSAVRDATQGPTARSCGGSAKAHGVATAGKRPQRHSSTAGHRVKPCGRELGPAARA